MYNITENILMIRKYILGYFNLKKKFLKYKLNNKILKLLKSYNKNYIL